MKVIEFCRMCAENTPIVVRGNGSLSDLTYKLPDTLKEADKEILNMEIKVVEMQFCLLVLHVGEVEFS